MSSKSLRLLLLGEFSARDPSSEIRITSRKGRALLAYLAMAPDWRAGREQLATLLWGDKGEVQARQSLRQCLIALRRDLGSSASVLTAAGENIMLAPAAVWVDARELLALSDVDDLARGEQAVAIYRGDFLRDFHVGEENFDTWVRTERARLQRAAACALEAYAQRLDDAADGRPAILVAEMLVAQDPLREDWQRLLIGLYARYSCREVALRHADEFQALLRRELGAEPEPATRALIGKIFSNDFQPVPSLPLATAVERDERPSQPVSAPAPSIAVPYRTGRWPLVTMVAMAAAAVVLAVFLPRAWQRDAAPPAAHGQPSKVTSAPTRVAAFLEEGVIPVVVLPFSTPAGNAALADQLTEDLIDSLSRVSSMRVISRQTAFQYRDHAGDVAALGAELGVRYAIQGRVRGDSASPRIHVELVDTTSRLQTWAGRFDRDWPSGATSAGLVRLTDEIVMGITRELQVGVVLSEAVRTGDRMSDDPTVLDLTSRGQALLHRRMSPESLAAALSYFEEALRRSPEQVTALIGAAATLVRGSLTSVRDRGATLDRAEALLARALALNPRSERAHYWRGLSFKARGEREAALDSLRRALELNPSYAPAYGQLGSVLVGHGRPREGLDHILYAMRLSPKDPAMSFWTQFAGRAELELGRDHAALEWYRRSAGLATRNPYLHAQLAAAYALAEDKESAIKHVKEFEALSGSSFDVLNKRGEDGAGGLFGKGSRLAAGIHLAWLSAR